MKSKTLTIIGIFAAALAAVLILCHKSISIEGVTITCGIIFVGVGLINIMVNGYKAHGAQSAGVLTVLTNCSAIVLGISMMVFRVEFRPMITFIFGLFVSLSALWQLYVLAIGTRPYKLPVWLYSVPALLAGGAVFIFMCKTSSPDSNLMLGAGISMAVLGVGSIMEGSVLGVARSNYHHAQAQREVNDVEATPTQQPQYQQPTYPAAAQQPHYPQQSAQPQYPTTPQPQYPVPVDRDAENQQLTVTDPQQYPTSERWSWKSRKPRIETTDDLDDELD